MYSLTGDGYLRRRLLEWRGGCASHSSPSNGGMMDFYLWSIVALGATGNCGGAADGLWAMDLTAKTGTVGRLVNGGRAAIGPAGAYVQEANREIDGA